MRIDKLAVWLNTIGYTSAQLVAFARERRPGELIYLLVYFQDAAGTVFAADGIRNEIYRLDGDALKLELSNPKLTSIRGLAVSGDGKTLYFADYSLGLLGIDWARFRDAADS